MNMNPLDTACGPIATDLDGCTVVEEECRMAVLQSSTEAFRDLHFVFVTGAPGFDSGPAQDGLEYLRLCKALSQHEACTAEFSSKLEPVFKSLQELKVLSSINT